MSRAIDWYIYESNREGGGWGGGPEFFRPPLQKFTGSLLQNLIILSESSAQAQSIGTLLGQIGLRWGGPVDVSNSQRHTRSGAGRRVSQANGAAIHSKLPGLCQHEIVSIVMKAMWGCASQLWVPGRSLVHGRPYLSFCPITLQHFNYRS